MGQDWVRRRIADITAGIEEGDRWPTNWLEIALLQNFAGNGKAAMDALNGAVSAGFLDADYLQVSPLFKPLSAQPAFAQLLDRIHARVSAQRLAVLGSGWAPRETLFATASPSE